MKLWYENENGDSVDLLNAPYWTLDSQDGLTSLPENNISTTNTILTEGAFVQNRKREMRQIVLNHTFHRHVRESRRTFIDVFDQESTGKIRYTDDEMNVFIPVEVETCVISNTDEKTTAVTTFLAPYPYFLDFGETRQFKNSVQGSFVFPFTFDIVFGTTTTSNIVNIENTGAVDVGFNFTLTASTGAVSNIRIQNQAGEYVALAGFSMVEGDRVEFSSIDNEKYVDVIHSNGTRVNLLGYFSGTFFKMHRGVNRLQLTATGAENATLEVVVRGAHKAV